MTLRFPNHSRWYDATRRAIRFWGYDSAMETSFFVAVEALKQLQPGMTFDETGLLTTFDAHRELILATATKVYRRGHQGSYDLGPDDF